MASEGDTRKFLDKLKSIPDRSEELDVYISIIENSLEEDISE